MSKIIIGLTGSFASGCTEISKFLRARGYRYVSLSEHLKQLYREAEGENGVPSRRELQDFGNETRQERGSHYLAESVSQEIDRENEVEKWVIDSIRNPAEILFLRRKYGNSCFIIGVYADYETRWQRNKDEYEEDERAFKLDDKRDSDEDVEYGQRVGDCYIQSDLVIANDKNYIEGNADYIVMGQKVGKYINLIENPFSDYPSEDETFMAMAYAASLRSSCLKRKVGAVIVDNGGSLFASGYNEVPRMERSCQKQYVGCYRSKLKTEVSQGIDRVVGNQGERDAVKELVKRYKNLDYCRSLHAEENAILNVARIGSSLALKDATLYTTTYPCNLLC